MFQVTQRKHTSPLPSPIKAKITARLEITRHSRLFLKRRGERRPEKLNMENGASNAATEYFTTSDDDDDDDISCGKIFTRACNRYHRLEIIMQPRVVRLSIFSRSTSPPLAPSSFFSPLPSPFIPLPFLFLSSPGRRAVPVFHGFA